MATVLPSRTADLPPPRITIFLVSAMALSYEILLMRLFSIVQYHHFAYMIISLALLGYGASGTFLVFAAEHFSARYKSVLIANILLFGLAAMACFAGGQHLLFNPDEMLWNSRQWLKLSGLYILLALPFFFAANCIALTFLQYRQRISEIYGADLFGAGFGSIFIIGLLYVFFPQKVLLFHGGLIFVVAAAAWLELGLQPRRWVLLFAGLAVLCFFLPARWFSLAISPYKGLSQQMSILGSRIIAERSSPLALLTVVANNQVPFRHAPGLSLAADVEPPEQLGIYMDGDAMSVITRFPQAMADLSYFDSMTSALPYHLNRAEDVLLFGVGAGADILQALYFEVPHISAVELNPQLVDLVRERPQFSGNLYDRPDVRVHLGEARNFVAQSRETFDLVQVPILDSFSGSAAGLYALNENYLYTVEALQEYISHLTGSGYLSMSRWVQLPPRDILKLFATAVAALRRLGAAEPAGHLAVVRSWQTSTLLVKKTPFTLQEIEKIRDFCRQRLFDLVYYPGMQRHEANRFNILREPYFYDGVTSLLSRDPSAFINRYKFDIRPATDDRPYFANFFKWRTLPEILKLKGQGGMMLLESGYLVLAITLLQAICASLVLILLPVVYRLHGRGPAAAWNRSRIVVYFFAIGLGFLFLEIAFIQKFILYLGHPLYAAATVLAIFLVFAGMGSRSARKKHFHAIWPVASILTLGVLELLIASVLFNRFAWLPPPIKVIAAIVMLGPLAFCMGMPFPLAMTGVGADVPDQIPWAWAVNGCASVIGAVLATLLSIHFGFSAVVLAALVLYGLAAAAFPSGQKLQGDT